MPVSAEPLPAKDAAVTIPVNAGLLCRRTTFELSKESGMDPERDAAMAAFADWMA